MRIEVRNEAKEKAMVLLKYWYGTLSTVSNKCTSLFQAFRSWGRRSLFPFRKRLLPLLTVDATIGNQAFSRDRSSPELNYKEANNTKLRIVLERTTLNPKLNLHQKLWKGLGSPVIDVPVK